MTLIRSWHWGREGYDDAMEHAYDTCWELRRACDSERVFGVIIGKARVRCEACREVVAKWERDAREVADEEEARIRREWAL